jgi:hypothetical protein
MPKIQYLNKKALAAVKLAEILNKRRVINKDKLLKVLENEFPSSEYIGCGVYREVYALNKNLVVKIQTYHSSQCNSVELETFHEFPKLVPKIYLHYQHGDIDILVSQRAKVVATDSIKVIPDARYKLLNKTFDDIHAGNVGFINNRLVAVDTGHGTF